MRRRMCFAKLTIAASATSDSWSSRNYVAASAAARYSRHPKDYISDEEPTAECPYCHIDAVIGDASGFPITEEFLRKMMHRWFG